MSYGYFVTVFIAAIATTTAAQAADTAPTAPQLRQELLAMQVVDQEVRSDLAKPDYKRWTEVHASNQRRLKEIVQQFGWPTVAMVGQDGAAAAWLLAQHSDSDPAFQRKVLELMAPLVEKGEASAKNYAYLYDRTHVPQRFGTQGNCVSKETWLPFEIEDIGGLAERRRQAGMPTMAEYADVFKDICRDGYTPNSAPDPTRRTIPLPSP
ncbi:MAG: hypothetical protein JWP59_4640 [Massilia sp.]|nr:hypothetical protein [Massilia sp.]